MKITVETIVKAPVAKVWHGYTTPEAITQWNAASDDWHTTKATVDLRVGGEFSSRMEAKDGSFGFDFAGTYTKVVPNELIEYSFGDRACASRYQAQITVFTVTHPGVWTPCPLYLKVAAFAAKFVSLPVSRPCARLPATAHFVNG